MAQYATPSADIVDGNWVDQGASNVDLYADIAPGTPGSIGAGDDATYAESPSAPSAEAAGFDLSTIEDPVSSTGHIMRWRRQKSASGGAQINLTVEVRQTYISEGSQGTLINSFADNNLPAAWATTTDTLTGGEADTITDYADLQVRFVANQV
jgi:hypothetical protein